MGVNYCIAWTAPSSLLRGALVPKKKNTISEQCDKVLIFLPQILPGVARRPYFAHILRISAFMFFGSAFENSSKILQKFFKHSEKILRKFLENPSKILQNFFKNTTKNLQKIFKKSSNLPQVCFHFSTTPVYFKNLT